MVRIVPPGTVGHTADIDSRPSTDRLEPKGPVPHGGCHPPSRRSVAAAAAAPEPRQYGAPMRFGLYAINYGTCADPDSLVRVAQYAEAGGLDSLWAGEHIVLPSPQPPDYGIAPEIPFLDAIVALDAGGGEHDVDHRRHRHPGAAAAPARAAGQAAGER